MTACGVSLIRAGVGTPEPMLARLRYRMTTLELGMAVQLTDTQAHHVRGPALCRGRGGGCKGRVHRWASNRAGVCTSPGALGETGSMDGP